MSSVFSLGEGCRSTTKDVLPVGNVVSVQRHGYKRGCKRREGGSPRRVPRKEADMSARNRQWRARANTSRGVWLCLAVGVIGCSESASPLTEAPAQGVGIPTAGMGISGASAPGMAATAGVSSSISSAAAGSGGTAQAGSSMAPFTPLGTAGQPAPMGVAGMGAADIGVDDADGGMNTTPDASAAQPDAALPASDAGVPVPDAGATEPPMHEDLGMGDGSDVITIGDSWMSLGTAGIQQSLLRASGQRYRTYGVPGTQLLNGQIPGQFTRAKMANPDIKTVVMTGGGNDILQTGLSAECGMGGPRCDPQLMKIGEGLAALWKQMGEDGVQDVVHVMYAAVAGDGLKDQETNNMMLAALCAAATPVRCHLLNTDALIPTEADLRDGIHPTDAGYDRIGKAVYELMTKEGMRR